MKTARIKRTAVIALAIITAISLKANIDRNNELYRALSFLEFQIFAGSMEISRSDGAIKGLLLDAEEGKPLNDEQIAAVFKISDILRFMDAILKQYVQLDTEISYDSDGVFLDIAETLSFDSILKDNMLSENEIQYLTILMEDTGSIFSGLNPEEMNDAAKSDERKLNNLLKEFFDKWDSDSENSPLRLIN